MVAETSQSRKALVVGASRGIGLGLTGGLARRGWHVTATARHSPTATLLLAAANAFPSNIAIETVDITDKESCSALAKRLADTVFDLIVMNPGIMGPGHQSLVEATQDEVGALFFANAISPVRLAMQLLPAVRVGGTVAFMSSSRGSIGANASGGSDLYRASKAALNMLTRSFAVMAVPHRKATVISLHPGWVKTDMGGANATLDISESVTGLIRILEGYHQPGHRFIDYAANELPW